MLPIENKKLLSFLNNDNSYEQKAFCKKEILFIMHLFVANQ